MAPLPLRPSETDKGVDPLCYQLQHLEKMGPASHLGSTVELTLLAEVQVSWPWGMIVEHLMAKPSSAM